MIINTDTAKSDPEELDKAIQSLIRDIQEIIRTVDELGWNQYKGTTNPTEERTTPWPSSK
jgi:hypothetical protein